MILNWLKKVVWLLIQISSLLTFVVNWELDLEYYQKKKKDQKKKIFFDTKLMMLFLNIFQSWDCDED